MPAFKSAASLITAGGIDATLTGSGTTPPALTLTGTLTDATVRGVQVRCTLGGARATWTGDWSTDGGVTWNAFTSAATVALGSTGLTLNIAVGDANVDNTWLAAQKTASYTDELDLEYTPSGAVAVQIKGTFVSAVLVAEGDVLGDGNWLPLQFESIPGGTVSTSVTVSTTAGVAYVIPRQGIGKIRVRCLSITSGTVSVSFGIGRGFGSGNVTKVEADLLTIHADVDGLEGLATTTNSKLDTVNTNVGPAGSLGASTSKALAVTAVQLDAGACIRGCYITNPYDSGIVVNIGTSGVTTSKGVQLVPGDRIFFPVTNCNLLYGISVSGTPTVYVQPC